MRDVVIRQLGVDQGLVCNFEVGNIGVVWDEVHFILSFIDMARGHLEVAWSLLLRKGLLIKNTVISRGVVIKPYGHVVGIKSVLFLD